MSTAGGKPAYRADIDGLRAVAVLAVVFYHLFDHAVPAGFLGVDIFFVISGYLITSILNREIEQGRFSILRFYERRVRRILPALIVVVAACLVVTLAFFLPFDLINFAHSLLATFAFVSNVYFWRDADYFAPEAITKPLLHTWSLGIEEQFYILFPWLLWLVAKNGGRSVALSFVGLVSAASFLLAGAALVYGKPLPAFYLLPTRAWELGIGAALALSRVEPPRGRLARELLASAGALLLLGGCAFMQSDWLQPMPAAAPSSIGTALVIWTGCTNTLIKRLLSLRPIVFIGLISYSLYLWHWPFYVFAHYLLIREPSATESLVLLLASIAAAYLSWRFVECPFRDRGMPIRRVLWITAGGVASLCACAGLVLALGGLPHRFSAAAARFNRIAGTNYRCPVSSYLSFAGMYACGLNLPSRNPADSEVVLLGNSHAQGYAPMVEPELEKRGLHGILVPAAGCLPVRSFNVSRECVFLSDKNLRGVANLHHVRIVIIAIGWHTIFYPMVDRSGRAIGRVPWSRMRAAMEDTIRGYRAAGWQVIVTGPIPVPGYNVASTVGREIAFHGEPRSPLSQPRSAFDSRFGPIEDWLRSRPMGVIPVYPSAKFCNEKRCSYLVDGQPAFADDNHLSRFSSESFRPLFARAIDAAERASAAEQADGTSK